MQEVAVQEYSSESDFELGENSKSLLQTRPDTFHEISDLSQYDEMEIMESDSGDDQTGGIDPVAFKLMQINHSETAPTYLCDQKPEYFLDEISEISAG